jgi:hypothetical protein
MALFSGKSIVALEACVRRHALIYHTCQLRDFRSYLFLGGVASRNLLKQRGLPFTPFDTDDVDQTNGVWDKVFFNFSDFGAGFANGGSGTPSPYGPICLVFEPAVLKAANDVAVTLRSAGATGFDREREGLSLDALPNIFVRYALQKYNVKGKEALKADFPAHEVGANPELNCSFRTQLAPISSVRYILVDPYPINPPTTLFTVVEGLVRTTGIGKSVHERNAKSARRTSYSTLWNAIAEDAITLETLRAWRNVDAGTIDWTNKVRIWDPKSFFYGRYSRYLRSGTITSLT